MRDFFFVLVMVGLVALGFYRPWLMTYTYLYTDIIQPQRISYLLRALPINFIIGAAAVVLFLFDKKKNLSFGIVQALMLAFVLWFTITSNMAVIQDNQVWFKWDAAWKSVIFAGVFMPLVLSTRRRIEGAIGLLILCVSLVTVSGGMKTLAGGGGYGTLSMIVDVNKGLYESSTISTVAIAVIPLILYMFRHSPLVGRTRLTKIGMWGLIASSLLILVGTEARTGLVCLAALAMMMFWRARQKIAIVIGVVTLALVALPFLPASFTKRMETITTPSDDVSASTRTEVWAWTLDFVADHPLGGGFRTSRLTNFSVSVPIRGADGTISGYKVVEQRARAFHSSYFEVLGEHGWPGLFIYISIIVASLVKLARLRGRYTKGPPEDAWVRDLSQALFRAILIYAVGGLFVGLAFQTTLYMFIGLGVATTQLLAARRAAEARRLGPLALRRRMGLEPPAPLTPEGVR